MRLGDLKFLNLFALVASASNPDRAEQWQMDGVSWTRERLSRTGPGYCIQIEICTLRHRGKRGWTLLSAHETWWSEARREAFRNGRWVHLASGSRTDVLKWFAARQAELEG